ncbi:hypothetical protein BGZ61DRAFT_592497 [Ilyonectria robusta]|uniref:uncharacterized protein n=1 Tax=Ilyonectria robusta TaxID=1079257 RepID=UPI001E8DB8AA|nr:uncharacterized protein BGZ61DRAFT_592497 [Ilyonectria robusta]KAH8667688.1 hypothetical protein BGZ61DRAFT_592497 [Ilyonectria robusta]
MAPKARDIAPTTFNGKSVKDGITQMITFTVPQQKLMWAHIARHGLVPDTRLSHIDELQKAMGLDVLEMSAWLRVLRSVDDSLKRKCVMLSKAGVSPTLETVEGAAIWRYEPWVRRWAEPGWNGDRLKPKTQGVQGGDGGTGQGDELELDEQSVTSQTSPRTLEHQQFVKDQVSFRDAEFPIDKEPVIDTATRDGGGCNMADRTPEPSKNIMTGFISHSTNHESRANNFAPQTPLNMSSGGVGYPRLRMPTDSSNHGVPLVDTSFPNGPRINTSNAVSTSSESPDPMEIHSSQKMASPAVSWRDYTRAYMASGALFHPQDGLSRPQALEPAAISQSRPEARSHQQLHMEPEMRERTRFANLARPVADTNARSTARRLEDLLLQPGTRIEQQIQGISPYHEAPAQRPAWIEQSERAEAHGEAQGEKPAELPTLEPKTARLQSPFEVEGGEQVGDMDEARHVDLAWANYYLQPPPQRKMDETNKLRDEVLLNMDRSEAASKSKVAREEAEVREGVTPHEGHFNVPSATSSDASSSQEEYLAVTDCAEARDTTGDGVPTTSCQRTCTSQLGDDPAEAAPTKGLKMASKGLSSSHFTTQRATFLNLGNASKHSEPRRVSKHSELREAPKHSEPSTIAHPEASLSTPAPKTPTGSMMDMASTKQKPVAPPMRPSTRNHGKPMLSVAPATSSMSRLAVTSPSVVNVRGSPQAEVESFLKYALRARDLTMQLSTLGGAGDASGELKDLRRRHQRALEKMVQAKDKVNTWVGEELGWGAQAEGMGTTAWLLGWRDQW